MDPLEFRLNNLTNNRVIRPLKAVAKAFHEDSEQQSARNAERKTQTIDRTIDESTAPYMDSKPAARAPRTNDTISDQELEALNEAIHASVQEESKAEPIGTTTTATMATTSTRPS